jgi:hypothetical protein
MRNEKRNISDPFGRTLTPIALTPIVRDFESRRWRHGDSLPTALSEYTSRTAA